MLISDMEKLESCVELSTDMTTSPSDLPEGDR